MRLSHRALVVALTLAVLGTATPPTHAYYFHGARWPGGVVPYYNAASDQAWAVSRAVSAWNHSGANVRFLPVPRANAQLVISVPKDHVYCTEGRASVGYYPRGAFVTIFPAKGLTHACNRYWAARVMVHELGHVLGLQHEDRYCAAMNAKGSLRGGTECEPRVPWDWRCRLLERDDIAGVVGEYGGTVRNPAGPEVCPLYPAIASPGGLKATYDPAEGSVTITFRRPVAPVIPAFVVPSPWQARTSFAIAGLGRSCAKQDDPETAQHVRWHVQPRGIETATIPARQGTSCYSVWAVDLLGRPSDRPATVKVTVT